MEEEKTFYRYDYYEIFDGPVKLIASKYFLRKETPCGWWIKNSYEDKWISKTSRKKYAYPTKEEALVNFWARKKREKQILEARLNSLNTLFNYYEGQEVI